MLKHLLIAVFASVFTLANAAQKDSNPDSSQNSQSNITINNQVNSGQCMNGDCTPDRVLKMDNTVILTSVGQGVSPNSTISPAQAMALAKRAAIADAYRQLAEKLNGVKVEGRDYIKNMVAKRTEVRTCVRAMIRNATVMETRFSDGLCEVEVELRVSGKQWYGQLAQ